MRAGSVECVGEMWLWLSEGAEVGLEVVLGRGSCESRGTDGLMAAFAVLLLWVTSAASGRAAAEVVP